MRSAGLVVGLAALVTEHWDAREEGVELGLAAPRARPDRALAAGWKRSGRFFDLIGVEDRIGLQDAAGLVALFAGIGASTSLV
jgi:hypothetical protein